MKTNGETPALLPSISISAPGGFVMIAHLDALPSWTSAAISSGVWICPMSAKATAAAGEDLDASEFATIDCFIASGNATAGAGRCSSARERNIRRASEETEQA